MKLTKSKLKQIIKEEYDRFTEEEGLGASPQTIMDGGKRVQAVASDVVENGGSLLDISGALKKQGFGVTLQMGVLVVDSGFDKYFVGDPKKFEIGPEDEVFEVGRFVVGLVG